MIKLAIDMGTSVTKIYRADTNSGIVLAEPSCVAIAGETVKAIGKDAKNLVGKTAEMTTIVYPVYEGGIANAALAVTMLKTFLDRIDVKGFARKQAHVLVCVPCGIPDDALSEYAEVIEECGIKNVWFVEQPYLCALGAGAALSDADPVFCLDVGGGISNAAVVSGDGIISGIALNVGGNNMDANITAKIAKLNKLHVGALTAERIKNEIGTLAPDPRGTMVAEGSSTETCHPAATSVRAIDLTDCIRVYVDKVAEYAMDVLRNLPAEVAATVNRNGVYLSGGLMKIPYLPQYIAAKLNMRFHVGEEPQFTAVLGGGALLRDVGALNRYARVLED